MWTALRDWWGKGSDMVSADEQERIVTAVATLLEQGGTGLFHESQLPAPIARVRQAFRQELALAKRQGNSELFEVGACAYICLADVSELPPDAYARALAAHQRFLAGETEAVLDADYALEREHQRRRTEELTADVAALR